MAWLVVAAFALAAAAKHDARWAYGALASPLVAAIWLWPALSNIERFGLKRPKALALLFAPPERWAGPWPSALRRVGDVWDQLPPPVREIRTWRSLVFYGLPLVVTPAALSLFIGGTPMSWALAAWLIPALAGNAMMWSKGYWAMALLRGRDVPQHMWRKWVTEPTWNSPFWRRAEVSRVLAAPKPLEIPAIDLPEADPY